MPVLQADLRRARVAHTSSALRRIVLVVILIILVVGATGFAWWTHAQHLQYVEAAEDTRSAVNDLFAKLDTDTVTYDLADDRAQRSSSALGRASYSDQQRVAGVCLDLELDTIRTCRKLWQLQSPDYLKCRNNEEQATRKTFDDLLAN